VTPLEEYRRRRRPDRTPEPAGGEAGSDDGALFVIQRHAARSLHYDFRLEMDGVLRSWAVPKGIPLEVGARHLAVHVEDHPLEYATFEGTIPAGEYGGGTVEIWDTGTYELTEVKRDGGLTVDLHGHRLEGRWTLIPAHLDGNPRNWLMIRKHDGHEATAPATRHYSPMLATPADDLPRGSGWLYEVKWDGFRAVARMAGGDVELWSRGGHDLRERFPDVARALPRGLGSPDCVVDGEVCALDEEGKPSFSLLQSGNAPRTYLVFDLLELDRRELTAEPLSSRRELLEPLVTPGDPVVRLSPVFEDGRALLREVKERKLEGVVAKRASSQYRPGRRSGDWVKVKSRTQDVFWICGFTAGKGSRADLGALVLGAGSPPDLAFVGSVGSGLGAAELDELGERLQALRRDSSVFSPAPRVAGVTWVEPELRCRVEYTEWTRDGRLRAPVFVRLEAVEDPPKPKRRRAAKSGGAAVEPVNPEKEFWPGEGITKGDVFAYYAEVAEVAVPHLRDRPMTMLRYPDGIAGNRFYQRKAPAGMPTFVRRFERDGSVHPLVNDAASLAWMANMACIDLHPWNSRKDRPERPDWVVFDLDPSPDAGFSAAVEAALLLRQALTALRLEGVPKTSGADGMHVYVPIARRHDHKQARDFVAAVARALHRTRPDLITTAWAKDQRRGVLLDANQNGLGRTTASAYSARPVPGATVSTPLRWEEVTADLKPGDFTMDAVVRRVERHGDLFAFALSGGQRLP
jgi:bifunctional non-homologous end joining protein LigD